MNAPEPQPDGIEPLEPAVVKRLRELINEIIDIDRALERLTLHKNWDDIQCPVATLRKAMERRLCGSLNLLYGNDEEGN
jgi:signal transduction histidine kinase